MTMEAGAAGETPEYPSENYIARHWRGELSLAQSYWVNGVLLLLPFRMYFAIASAAFQAQPVETPVAAFEWTVLPFLLMFPLGIWAGVGIWRSAGRSIDEGRPGWAWVARIIVLINACLLIHSAVLYAQLSWSLGCAYFDQRNAHYEASIVQDRVIFSGEFTPESADALAPLLQTKGIARLVIRQSVGGYILPSLRIAKLIHDQGLTVVAGSDCASMCTVILAAGKDRLVMPTTIIRLHTGTLAGTNKAAEHWDEAESWYLQAGMTPDLLAKIRVHRGSQDLYEPTMSELIYNGLATAVYDQTVGHFVPALDWCEQNATACSHTGRQNRGPSAKH
jgi:hypothetical protein